MRKTHIPAYLLTLTLIVLAIGCAGTRQTPPVIDEPVVANVDLRALITGVDTLLVEPLEADGATVSVLVGDVRTGTVLYEHDSDRYMVPASVQKLFVAADAMLSRPEDFRFETILYSNGPLVDSTLHGDLILQGGWDPSLSGDKPYVEWPWTVFDSLATELKAQGVNLIEGDIVVEAAAYIPGGWEIGDMEYRFAPRISQLTFNDGLVSHAQKVTGVGGIGLKVSMWPNSVYWSVPHTELWPRQSAIVSEPKPLMPPLPIQRTIEETPIQPLGGYEITYIPSQRPRVLAGDAFREALRRAGIQGGDTTRAVSPLPMQMPQRVPQGVWLTHQSAPTDDLLSAMLKHSSNAWAEQIAAGTGSYTYSGYRLRWPTVLDSLGLDPDEGMVAADACGLSRRNRMRAETMHQFLVGSLDRWGDRWLMLLPHANERESTLKGRMEGLEGHVLAKTGSMSGTRTLAGYIFDDRGRLALDFVILVNHAPNSPISAMDDAVRAMVAAVDVEE